ncbi:biotin--[acetyl-CoA-carboxylase] ligase [Lentibacillus sediminis]|uniref:biotin--[acetyl-CoA-carboxylase] ligase n=1 Tax=Lentibacillus sediminis TaxID=1940529 RepID=UPI000C1BCAAE|nr:biotin--[acetyl-CoA-carboxylase] ligase [Lentibacillus sediminis]
MQSTRNRLIKLLDAYPDTYISGQQLSNELNISRNAVWKHMNELKKDGYKIESRPKKGYRIISLPAKLSENTLQWGLDTAWIGKNLLHKETVASTQLIAHEKARENTVHGTVVIADEQTKGKGRMDRSWHSAKGKGIWMSIILRPSISPSLAPQLTLMTATVLADVLHKHTGKNPQIKWPNDILFNGKKIAGILTEMQAEQDQIQYLVIGIGLNVNHSSAELPAELEGRASSLKLETGKNWQIQSLIQEILTTFEQAFDLYMEKGFRDVKQKWESYGYKVGRTISIKTMRDHWKGTFLGIAEDGALLATDKNGETEKFYSAEIDWS